MFMGQKTQFCKYINFSELSIDSDFKMNLQIKDLRKLLKRNWWIF